MSLSNLPPGVSVNDIPGNRPEDEEWETFWEKVYEQAGAEEDDKAREIIDRLLDSEAGHKVATAITELAYAVGAAEERANAEIERAMAGQEQAEAEEALRLQKADESLRRRLRAR